MPRPSAWTKNVLSGTKKFCLGQKYFVRDKIFWSPVKSSFLFMKIQFRSCSKFFVRDKKFLSWRNFFCPRQNFFVPDKTFFVHAEGRGISCYRGTKGHVAFSFQLATTCNKTLLLHFWETQFFHPS